MENSIFPIEDSYIEATQGDKIDLVARGRRRHMGNPGAEEILSEALQVLFRDVEIGGFDSEVLCFRATRRVV